MRKLRPYAVLLFVLPVLSGCVIGTVVGTTAEVAGSAVSIGAKATKTGAGIATGTASKVSKTVLGEKDKPEQKESGGSEQ